MRATKSGNVVFRIGLAFVFASMLGATGARAENKLLAEAVDFTGTFIYLGAKPPGLVIGAIRDGETVVRGSARLPTAAAGRPTATQ
jgi:serine-type D-Ala-D-Ala carboxypeptidase/endopeptidase